MRLLTLIALVSALAIPAATQDVPHAPVYRILKLTLASSDLSRAQRQIIVKAFEGGAYDLDGLGERIRFKLRDTGYEMVKVGEPQIMHRHLCDIDVRYTVQRGAQYRLAGITFQINGNPVFPPTRLRAEFPLADGSVFSTSAVARGLESVKDLYGSDGYANFGAIPKPIYDNAQHTIRLAIDIDQGTPVSFGRLLLDGIEPRAGAAKALLASWGELEGRLYSPHLLKDWLKQNTASWPPAAASQAHIEYIAGSRSAFNVLLHFQ